MIKERFLKLANGFQASSWNITSVGHMIVFIWLLAMAIVVPFDRGLAAAGFACMIGAFLHPKALRRLASPRWVLFLCLLLIPQLLWTTTGASSVFGVFLTHDGMLVGVRMVLRAIVVLIAVEGLTKSVSISEIAGIFERMGLHGLGFSIGVAINIFPLIGQSAQHTWRSMYMRGGLHRRWWRNIRILILTVMGNALSRADEIAVAAEARGFSPGRAHFLPLVWSIPDRIVLGLALMSYLIILLMS